MTFQAKAKNVFMTKFEYPIIKITNCIHDKVDKTLLPSNSLNYDTITYENLFMTFSL